ncbi:hypothetical protein GCM10009612_69610 [Streptomyces beijiangensis]
MTRRGRAPASACSYAERQAAWANVAVQLGKAMGAHVTGLARADNLDLVRDLGADEALDYRAVAPSGRIVTITFVIDPPASTLGYLLASTVHGHRRVRFFSGNPKTELFTDLAALVEEGAIR